MKATITMIFMFLGIITANAEQLDGYYISKTGDTVKGKVDVPIKSKAIKFDKLTFDFKFSQNEEKFKKIDRLDVQGFGFEHEGKKYDFITWDVKANKQIYRLSRHDNVASDGVYFILRTEEKFYPIYSLFQSVDENIRVLKDPVRESPQGGAYRTQFNGFRSRIDVIIKHPTKGFLLILGELPGTKMSDIFTFLEMEEEFTNTLTKKEKDPVEVIVKYNDWKAK